MDVVLERGSFPTVDFVSETFLLFRSDVATKLYMIYAQNYKYNMEI
jgi:hypothetical protein